MVHTIQNLKTSNLNLDFEFQQLLGSLKHIINLVMQIRYTECHRDRASFKIRGKEGRCCSDSLKIEMAW
jgi:hypothetical protein